MIGLLISAISLELKALFAGTDTTIYRDTEFKLNNMLGTQIPLVIFSIEHSDDEFQCLGGLTQLEWNIDINAFFYDENSMIEDDTGYNSQAYDIIDKIRRYFVAKTWQSTEMQNLCSQYGFNIMLEGAVNDTMLEKQGGGIIPGYGTKFKTIAVDTQTQAVQNKTFAHTHIEGVVFINQDLSIDYNFLTDVVTMITQAQYNALTNASVGQRYYLTDLKKVNTVQTIDPVSHLITASTIYSLVKYDVFISADNPNKAWVYDGSAIYENDLVVQVQT